MKKVLTLILACILIGSLLCGCQTPSVTADPTENLKPQFSMEPIPSYNVVEQDDKYEWVEENDKYTDAGYDTSNMVAVDELGRVTMPYTTENDKQIGMYYHVGEGFFKGSSSTSIYDAAKIIEEYGPDKVFKQKDRISPNNKSHYWGEPLYGYYDSNDPYMIKKQLELFTYMGIDYLVTDVTNGFLFNEATEKLLSEITKLRNDGWDAPQVVFYVHSLNNKTVRELYRDIHSMTQYQEAWYKRDGKPVIIAYTETAKDIAEAGTRGVTDFSDPAYADLSQEILDFYYFVEPRWPNDSMTVGYDSPIYDKKIDGKWTGYAWIEWKQPLRVRSTSLGDYMNVAVASHPNIPFSFSITRGVINWGRNYDIYNNKKVEGGLEAGTYYQICWDQAHEKQPDTLCLVAWNAWTALKSEWAGEYIMCDTCDYEYSLSIEPANGYYKDNYVHQSTQNIRKFKNDQTAKTYYGNNIDINGSVAQWYNVEAVYRQFGTEAYGRDYMSADGKKYHYTEEVPHNNIQEVRTTHDLDNIYMMIRCGDNITERYGDNWMNVFLSAGNPDINNGWEGYSYVINRTAENDGKVKVQRLDKSFGLTDAGEAEMVVVNEFMFLKIPRSVIGMENTNTFYFKVADTVKESDNMMSYYTSGSVFPVGRYSYSYTGK